RFAFAAEAARRKRDLIDGRARARALRAQLLRLISPPGGISYRRDIKPVSSVRIEKSAPIDGVAAYIALAQQRRADLNQARLQVVRNELDIVATRNGLLPRLNLFVSLGQNGFGRDNGN